MIYNIGFRKDFDCTLVSEMNSTSAIKIKPKQQMYVEPPPYCNDEMGLEELISRRDFFKESIRLYYTNVQHRESICPVDPQKFIKLKAYQTKRFIDTEYHIEKLLIAKNKGAAESWLDVLQQVIW